MRDCDFAYLLAQNIGTFKSASVFSRIWSMPSIFLHENLSLAGAAQLQTDISTHSGLQGFLLLPARHITNTIRVKGCVLQLWNVPSFCN